MNTTTTQNSFNDALGRVFIFFIATYRSAIPYDQRNI